MSLIKCPECKRKVSDTAVTCPHCGFNAKAYMGNSPAITQTKKVDSMQKKRSKIPLKKRIKYILSFAWADELFDKISGIPIIGGLLAWLILFVAVLIMAGVGLFLLILIFSTISEFSPVLATVLMLIGMNVIAWFSSYRWGCHKYYFWLCLILTILALYYFVFGFAF